MTKVEFGWSLLTSAATGQDDFPRRLRRKIQQGFQGPAGLVAHARFKPVAGADKRNDGGGFHEINVSARAAEQSPSAVTKRGRGTERDERVHVGAANFDLPPRAAIKLRATKNLHGTGQREREPLKPRRHGEMENPFANHQHGSDGQAKNQVPLPVALPGLVGSVRRNFFGVKASL